MDITPEPTETYKETPSKGSNASCLNATNKLSWKEKPQLTSVPVTPGVGLSQGVVF